MRIIENTFPQIAGKAGDLVHWEHDEKRFKLFHDETGKIIYQTAEVDNYGCLVNGGKPVRLVGTVLKDEGMILKLGMYLKGGNEE